MSQPDRLTGSADAQFHPACHYNSPADVLKDVTISSAEKRVILSSWASDMYTVDSRPARREIPGLAEPLHLKDILAALRQLGDDDDRPRDRGAAGGVIAQAPGTASDPGRPRVISAKSRWSSEANVRRYRKLLATQLTEHERRFVERRLAEELAELRPAEIKQ